MNTTSGYRNHKKTEWRENVWQDIAAHVRDVDGHVLTLAGTSFLDRKTARKHGVSLDRVIGVDQDVDAVKHNVKHGRTVLQCPLHLAIAMFNRPIAAINADVCAGSMSESVASIIKMFMFSEWTKNALLVLNVSVGREVQKPLRDDFGGCHPLKLDRNIHRARLALLLSATNSAAALYATDKGCDMWSLSEIEWKTIFRHVADAIDGSFVASYGRYVGNRQPMDSIVVRQFWHGPRPIINEDIDTKRHIASKMARHTMRFAP